MLFVICTQAQKPEVQLQELTAEKLRELDRHATVSIQGFALVIKQVSSRQIKHGGSNCHWPTVSTHGEPGQGMWQGSYPPMQSNAAM